MCPCWRPTLRGSSTLTSVLSAMRSSEPSLKSTEAFVPEAVRSMVPASISSPALNALYSPFSPAFPSSMPWRIASFATPRGLSDPSAGTPISSAASRVSMESSPKTTRNPARARDSISAKRAAPSSRIHPGQRTRRIYSARMPAALVTGATGFVGSHLVDLLLERGWRVSALVRKSSNLRWIEDKPVQRVDPETSPFPDCDVLFHVAGVIRADTYADYLAGNRDLAVRVFEAARAKRFVHVSSLAAAGPGEALDESTPCRPISLYGRSKWEGELAVWARRVRVPVTVIRPPVVYGPRDFGLFDLYVTVAKGLRP